MPAIPTTDLLKAVRAGRGVGDDVDKSDSIAMALATAVGDTATAPLRTLRAGVRDGAALGSIVGTDDVAALRVDARATCCDSLPMAGKSAAASVGLAASTDGDACRATVEADGLSCG